MLLCGLLCQYGELLLEQKFQVIELAIQLGLYNCFLIWSEIKVVGFGRSWGHMLDRLDLPVSPVYLCHMLLI